MLCKACPAGCPAGLEKRFGQSPAGLERPEGGRGVICAQSAKHGIVPHLLFRL